MQNSAMQLKQEIHRNAEKLQKAIWGMWPRGHGCYSSLLVATEQKHAASDGLFGWHGCPMRFWPQVPNWEVCVVEIKQLSLKGSRGRLLHGESMQSTGTFCL